MSIKIADLLTALSAACMIGSMVLLGIDVWLIWQDRKKRREEDPDDHS